MLTAQAMLSLTGHSLAEPQQGWTGDGNLLDGNPRQGEGMRQGWGPPREFVQKEQKLTLNTGTTTTQHRLGRGVPA